jgi:glutathione S-transferase
MLQLVIGNKNLSSWSLRAWLLLRHLDLPFTEILLRLDTPEFETRIGEYSSARRVPVLIDGEASIWDSLAICEYLNEHVSGRAWPEDRAARAHARSISAEMHSGFAALRQTWSMNATAKLNVEPTPQTLQDVARIDAIWHECLQRYGGPWLFGSRFSIADAMYAPVVLRFNTYGPTLSAPARTYLEHVLADHHLEAWIEAARGE